MLYADFIQQNIYLFVESVEMSLLCMVYDTLYWTYRCLHLFNIIC